VSSSTDLAGRPAIRGGLVLLAVVFALAVAGPWLWRIAPDRPLDPAAAALAPPGSRFRVVTLADGRELAAERIESTPSGLRLFASGRSRDVAQRELAVGISVREVRFWLGSDRFGRDVAARLLSGARLSLTVGFAALLVSLLLGVPLGLAAGLTRRLPAAALLGGIETAQAFPRLYLLLALAVIVPPSRWTIVAVLGATGWMPLARLVRAEARRVAASDFVLAARALGAGPARIAFVHVLPNVLAPVMVEASLGMAGAVSAEAALSFLGIGVPPPAASWGNLLAEGRDVLAIAPWISIAPTLALAVTLVGCSLLAEGLRDRLDRRAAFGAARRRTTAPAIAPAPRSE